MQCIQEGNVINHKIDEMVGGAVSGMSAGGLGASFVGKYASGNLTQGAIHKVSPFTNADAKRSHGLMVYPYIESTLYQAIQTVLSSGEGGLLRQYFGSLAPQGAVDDSLYQIALGWYLSYVLKMDGDQLAVGQITRLESIIDRDIYPDMTYDEYHQRLGTSKEISLTPIFQVKWLEIYSVTTGSEPSRPKTPQWLIEHFEEKYDPWMGSEEEVQEQIRRAKEGL